MSKLKVIIGASVVAAAMFATSANAVIITFAQFSASSAARNVRWLNNGTGSAASSSTATGTGGRLYTTSTATAITPGISAVNFQFLQAGLSQLGIMNANFFMDITVTNQPATMNGNLIFQPVMSGVYSFTSTAPITIGSNYFAAGANLLSASFTGATLLGSSTSGSFTDNSQFGTVLYTSDFLDFTGTISRDFAMSLTSITPVMFANPGKAIRTFRALAGGSFSSDPAPIVNVVPEPQVWGLLVVGFGMVGVQIRRRARQTAVAA